MVRARTPALPVAGNTLSFNLKTETRLVFVLQIDYRYVDEPACKRLVHAKPDFCSQGNVHRLSFTRRNSLTDARQRPEVRDGERCGQRARGVCFPSDLKTER